MKAVLVTDEELALLNLPADRQQPKLSVALSWTGFIGVTGDAGIQVSVLEFNENLRSRVVFEVITQEGELHTLVEFEKPSTN